MPDVLFIQGMKFYAHHGVLPEERTIGGNFEVDVRIEADFSSAIEKDELQGAVDYSKVYSLVEKEMKVPSNLIEHVAGRIATAISSASKLSSAIEVTVHKLRPPVDGVIERVSATVRK